MKNIGDKWIAGGIYLLADNLVSFYVFFTSLLAGVAWVYRYCELNVAIPLSIVMFSYIANVMVFSWFKGNAEGTRLEVKFSFCYTVIFVILFVVGLIVDWKVHLIMMSIILCVTGVAVLLREIQEFELIQAMIFGAPFILMTLWLAEISSLPLVFKIIIPVVYLMCAPFIAYYEDNAAAQNIFELAYDNTWDPEYEKHMKELTSKDIVV